MNPRIHRRDFLKLTGAASLSLLAPPFLTGKKNIRVVLFDAPSARNIALYVRMAE